MKRIAIYMLGLSLTCLFWLYPGPGGVYAGDVPLSGLKTDTLLNIEFFSADVTAAEGIGIPAEQIVTFSLDTAAGSGDREAGQSTVEYAANRVQALFTGKIGELVHYASYNNVPDAANLDHIRWMRNDYLIRLIVAPPGTGSEKGYRLNLELFDLKVDNKFGKDIDLAQDKQILAAVRKENKILFFVFQVKEKEAVFHAEFRWDNCTIYSKNQVWNDTDFTGKQIIFPNSKAVFTAEGAGKNYVLYGIRIIFDREKNLLTGEKAELCDGQGNTAAAGEKIQVPINDPTQYKVEK